LRSPAIEGRSLEQAVEQIASTVTADTDIRVSVRATGKPRRCSPRMENEILRIGHEAMMNAVRHAKATAVAVELTFGENSVALRVSDNGCGFDLAQASSGSDNHFGLTSMQERARTLGGHLKVVTSLERGTDVQATFPMDAIA
jgi:signal transduction histidine kinase